MKIVVLWVLVLGVLLILGAFVALRMFDEHADRAEWARLRSSTEATAVKTFDPSMVAGLPDPVRRWFEFAILPGAPLLSVATINMGGEFSLGTKDLPKYQAMKARQILASPHGFVWQLNLPGGISGSDSGLWTRFRILGWIPVARMGGDGDHRRAAFGRMVAEAIFWTPAAMLPMLSAGNISWEAVSDSVARVTVSHEGLSQSVELTIGPDGQPSAVSFMRWSNANPEKVWQLQPFGGALQDFRSVQGFRVPFDVEAGNFFGTPAYFPFYKAKLESISFH